MKEAYTNGVFDIDGYGGDINNRDACSAEHPNKKQASSVKNTCWIRIIGRQVTKNNQFDYL